MEPDRVRVVLADLPHMGVRSVARTNVYVCPVGVAQDAKNVPIEAFPKSNEAPFRVRLTHGSRPVLARQRLTPDPGERVLVCLVARDLLSLFVATVAA